MATKTKAKLRKRRANAGQSPAFLPGMLGAIPNPNGWPIVSNDPRIQRDYQTLRALGQSHNMAEILAHRQPPGTKNTDRAFLEGTHNHSELAFMPDAMAARILNEAKAAGIETTGKIFQGRLGSHTDAHAWVSSLSDVKRVCEEKNWTCEEAGVVAHEEPPEEAPALAEDIVQEEIEARIERDPSLARDLGELREQVIEEHSYKG